MPRKVTVPVPMSIEEELISLYSSGQPGKKRWFVRKMKEQPPSVQESIRSRLQLMGHSLPKGEHHEEKPKEEPKEEPKAEKQGVITRWTDQEWDRLAALVWGIRKNDPADSLIGLVRRAVEQFPADRRRTIRVMSDLKPLISRLTIIDKQYASMEDKLRSAEESVQGTQAKVKALMEQLAQAPSKEDILGKVDDDEVIVYFSERVLSLLPPADVIRHYPPEAVLSSVPASDLLTYALRSTVDLYFEGQQRLTGAIMDLTEAVRHKPAAAHTHTRPSIPMPRPQSGLPKVSVVGLLPEQAKVVEQKLKGRATFNFVDKNRTSGDAIPFNQDFIVLAANFISHSIQEVAKKKAAGTSTKIVIHHGGTDTMVRKLNELLPQLEAVS
jgi:hypothetical protein